MQRIVYRNPGGAEIVFAAAPPFVFESVSGINGMGTQMITTAAALQHGKTFHGLRLDDRTISVKFNIEGKTREDMYRRRREAIQITSPSIHQTGGIGRLTYYNDFGGWTIPCVVKSDLESDKRTHNFNHCKIDFYCPSPFFRSLEPETQRLTYMDAGLEFPLDFDSETGVQFGLRGYKNRVFNYGDALAPIQLTIHGPATLPEVIKSRTGEFVRISRQLYEGDTLYINTDPDDIEVTVTRQNGQTESAFGYVDLESTFFLLEPGENELEYQSGDDTTTALVEVVSQSWYGGV